MKVVTVGKWTHLMPDDQDPTQVDIVSAERFVTRVGLEPAEDGGDGESVHTRVHVWCRGKHAGYITVETHTGAAEEIAQRLINA